jgi:hypothetical protein
MVNRQRIRQCAALVVASVAEASDTPVVSMCGRSRLGKAKNRDNGIAQGVEQIDRDYFNRVCLLPAPNAETEFEPSLRMPRRVYEVLREGLLETGGTFCRNRMPLESSAPPRIRKCLRIAPAGVQSPDGLLSSLSFSIRQRKRPVSSAAAHGARSRRSISNLCNTVFCAKECFHLAQDKSSCEPNIAYSAL